MKKSQFFDAAEKTLEALGGKENIVDSYHCATRLRSYVKDKSKVDVKKIKALGLAKGTNWDGDQFQIIFGAGTVNKVFDEFSKMLPKNTASNNDKPVKKQGFHWDKRNKWYSNIFLMIRFGVRYFADIFIPLIPVFIVGGISLALVNFIKAIADVNTNYHAANASFVFDMVGGAVFGFLPAFIGFTSMKKFGGNPFYGLAIGLIMVAPNLVNSWNVNGTLSAMSIIGAPANGSRLADGSIATFALFPDFPEFFQFRLVGYQAQVFPVIAVVLMAYFIEKVLKKYLPEFIAILAIPLGTVLITMFFGFWIVGPTFKYVAIGLSEAFKWLFNSTNIAGLGFGGLVFAFFYPFLVVTGLHQGFLPIETQLIADQGFSWITPVATVSNISQGMAGAAMIVWFLIHKKRTEAIKHMPGAVSANLGITEPVLYGLNVPLKFAFIGAAIGSAVGGYWIGATHTVSNSLGSASWLGFIQFDFTNSGEAWLAYMADKNAMLKNLAPVANIGIASALASVVAFLATYGLTLTRWGKRAIKEFFGEAVEEKLNRKQRRAKKEEVVLAGTNQAVNLAADTPKQEFEELKVYSPIAGKMKGIEDFPDPTFAAKLLGDGVMFIPDPSASTVNVYAPISGKVETVLPTGHAYGITNDDNISVFMHLGVDTVNLNGEGFKPLISQGDFVKAGQLIATYEANAIRHRVKSVDVAMVVLDESQYKNIEKRMYRDVQARQFAFVVKK
ncbi:PTS beta-glucoside transporter subunit IIBCA [Mycoplasmopsis agassizii]|uniref:PTS beta-glucoside transporter subunit IIBCA n=1 Tax=Mycoplasmopsis agassizii TaxID=33922 RepID=A0ABX4H4J0_9BACT|nr:glucose PTS transporter subunit IIA [Mycoplasmopsis agassizii]PAF54800.1 PTS beta-glucoside transporter subunit IIBCA [Mycoplasmopsis agassizii]SMC19275.1 PTS system, sucrose-specific IIC component [Mycoplasmopsis agassizii]